MYISERNPCNIESVHFSLPEFIIKHQKMIKNYEFFNKYDTLLLMTDSISMKSDLNEIDNMINNGVVS